MFDDKEESLKLKLLEMLMEEMDGESAHRLKKPGSAELEIEIGPEGEEPEEMMAQDDMGEEMEESPEDKLRRRIGALRK